MAPNQTTSIRCTPQGICSWNFNLEGDGHRGTVELGLIGEQGAISADGMNFDILKHGVLSGRWTLNHEGNEVASVQKVSAFKRTFEIEDPGGSLLLRADSAFGRSFRLERAEELVATYRADHLLTRRGKIEIVADQWDSPTVFFSFWLVALMWRRASQNNNGG